MQLFIVGALLLLLAPSSKPLGRFLFILGLGVCVLSMDEAAAIHDNIYRLARRLKLRWIEGAEYLIWMAAYLLVAVVGLVLGRGPAFFAWRHFRREVLWVAAGGAIFVGGGIGLEIVTHYLFDIAVDAKFFLAVAAEEFFEMAGVSVMLYGIMLLVIELERKKDNDRAME